MVERIRNHLKDTYPGSAWVVTVYDPVYGFDKHPYYGYNIFHQFRYEGVNIVLTRFPKYAIRSPSPAISTIVGSIGGESDAETVVNTISERFRAYGETYTLVHAVRRSSTRGAATASYIPPENYFLKSSQKSSLLWLLLVSFNVTWTTEVRL